jgi:hypothetical protein
MDENENVATMDTEDEALQNADEQVSNEEQEQVEQPEEPVSTREVLSKAFDDLQKKGEEQAKAKDAEKGARKVSIAPPQGEKPVEKQPENAGKEIDPVTGRELEPVKAPQSLPASLRETWKTLPRSHQEYWAKRELDIAQTYSRLGATAKFGEKIQQASKPVMDYAKQNNLNYDDLMVGVFNDLNQLWYGTPQEKAQMIHAIITNTQPDAQTLMALFNGQQVNIPKRQQPVDIDAEVEKRLAEKARNEVLSQTDQAIQAFKSDPANEFAGDVEEQMAALITGGFVPTQGKTYPEILKTAYDMAVKLHPEIQQILTQRGQGQQQTPPQQGNKPVVKAVRSAKPSLGSGSGSKTPAKTFKTTREAAQAAFDELYGGN